MADHLVGIDNYGLLPMRYSALETLDWASKKGAAGVQFSGLPEHERQRADAGYFRAIGQFAKEQDLYLEWGGGKHIPFDMESWKPLDLMKNNERAVAEASLMGASIIRSCSGGLMRWKDDSPMTEVLLDATADALIRQKSLFKDNGMILAIETHFEFTTHELKRLFERCDAEPGDWLGICLDTMNLLIMLEDPLSATERILPWIVSTHIKDGGIIQTDKGFIAFPSQVGSGIADLKRIIKRLEILPWPVNLSIEDHGGSFEISTDPLFLSKFPDLSTQELNRLHALAGRTSELMSKNGLVITDRESWPGLCESRLVSDIETLNELCRNT